ncbi:MAG: hypothetical protein AB8H80_18040 [Planctomycetota bacterium]
MVNWSFLPRMRGLVSAKLLSSAGLLGLLLVSGCRTVNPVNVDGNFIASPALAERSPGVVSVLPVEDGSGGAVSRHLTFMRQELRRQLSDRLYAATTEQWVDASLRGSTSLSESILTPASLERVAAAGPDDAVFAVRVERWDESTLLANRRVRFRLQAALVAKDGTQLWSGDLEGTVKAGGAGAAPIGKDAAARSCVELSVRQLLLRLPDRVVR